MATKRRAVVNADADHLRRVQALIARGRFKTWSDFVREAVSDKLAVVERELLADEVARYCAAGHADEDADLIAAQAIGSDIPKRQRPARRRRATR